MKRRGTPLWPLPSPALFTGKIVERRRRAFGAFFVGRLFIHPPHHATLAACVQASE